jgi:hypothetical protein
MNGNGHPRIDYTHKDYASLREAMLELATEKLPAWTDHSPNDLGVLLLELFAYMGDIMLYYQDRIANESYLDTAVERRSVVNLLRLLGYELRAPTPASADLWLLFADDAAGTVTIESAAEFETSAETTGDVISFQYVREPLTIDLDLLPIQLHTDGQNYKFFKTLPVIQVDNVVTDEVAGSSDGSAGQRFALAGVPLIEGTLEVRVDEGGGPRLWERQSSLLYSSAGDEHYYVRRDENGVAWIGFGDDKYGKIPRRARNNIFASYRTGGGEKGNVPSLTITEAVTDIDQLELVFNPGSAAGGAAAEPSEEAAVRAPHLFRAMGRAVTAHDYEAHAQEFGVGKARARSAGWNRIDLFVAPAGGGLPTDTLKEDLRSYFESKRMMTSFVEIRDPHYISVYVEGTLEVEAYFYTTQVQERVENAVRGLLAFENVTFEARLYLSKVYEAIEAIEGVRGVNVTRFARSDSTEALPADGTLRFGWDEIPQAGHTKGILLTGVIGGRRVS